MLKIKKDDTVLTLTSGGCNALNLLLHGAGHVVSVDCNPAQSALLELKATGIRYRRSFPSSTVRHLIEHCSILMVIYHSLQRLTQNGVHAGSCSTATSGICSGRADILA